MDINGRIVPVAGKINAVSGEARTAELQSEPQNYVVVPGHPWLDGFSVRRATEDLTPQPPKTMLPA